MDGGGDISKLAGDVHLHRPRSRMIIHKLSILLVHGDVCQMITGAEKEVAMVFVCVDFHAYSAN